MTGPGTSRGGRPPGLPKTGGRTKGTPNRSTVALRERLAELGCDPVEELVKIAHDSVTERVLRANIYSLFLRYTHPIPRTAGNSDEDATTEESAMTLNDALKWAQYVVNQFGPNAAQPENQTLEKEGESNPSNTE
jgi:hypothetical protein